MAGLCLLGQMAQAELPARALTELQADAWRARTGFHLLSIRGNNPADQNALDELLARGNEKIAALKTGTHGEPETQWVAELQAAWVALAKRARNNPLATQGYADYGAMSEINTDTLAVDRLVRDCKLASASRYQDIYALSVRLQKLASEYLALSAFPSAGLPTGTQQSPMDFAVSAQAIDTRLSSLVDRYRGDKAAEPVVGFIRQRWEFIRGAIPKMNDNGASKIPYLFARYSNQIAEKVESLAVAY